MEITANFVTKDLYFASVLYALDIRLVNTFREGKTFWFEFDNAKNCNNVFQKYIKRELEINAKKYQESIKALKELIFVN